MRRLILRPGAIGDCILCLPALQHLAADYTEIWISSAVVPLIEFADHTRPLSGTGIDLVGIGDLPTHAKLAKYLSSFDSIVSWYGTNRPEFRRALLAINKRCEFLPALPPAWQGDHTTTFFNAQVGAKDSLPRITVPAQEPRDSMVIHPFSGGIRKNWPLANFQALAARVSCKTEWTAGPEEDLPNLIRFDNLRELASWLRGSALYIGNDSGITHLAAAVGLPTIALFGPTDPAHWAPRGDHVTVLRHEPIQALQIETVLSVVLNEAHRSATFSAAALGGGGSPVHDLSAVDVNRLASDLSGARRA